MACPAVDSSQQSEAIGEPIACATPGSADVCTDPTSAHSGSTQAPARPLEACLTDAEKAQLSWKQIGVLENLASGLSITDAARLVKVSRDTIYRWLNENAIVRAAYNRWKLLSEQSAEARLVALRDTAIDVIAEQIVTKRDGRLAMSLLKSLQVLKPAELGPTSPALVKQQVDAQRIESHVESAKRMDRAQSGIYSVEKYLVKDDETPASES
jgi:transposase